MEFNYGQIINDLISIFLLATVLLFLNNKAKEQADGKVGGIKITTIRIICIAGILINLLLIAGKFLPS